MTNFEGMNIASAPGEIYRELRLPYELRQGGARVALFERFAIDPNGLNPQGFRTGWKDINDAILKETGFERDILETIVETGKKIVGMYKEFPWLLPDRARRTGLTLRQLDMLIGDHEYDFYPGLYGITRGEGLNLRAAVNGRGGSSDILQGHNMTYRGYCELLGVTID